MIETKIIVKPKGNSGTGNSSGASGYGGEYVSEADYAARAGKAKKAESADLATRANTANTADRAKYADKAGELDGEAEVLLRYIRKDIDGIAQGTVTWEKVQKFLGGLLVGEDFAFDKNGYIVAHSITSDGANVNERKGFSIIQTDPKTGKYKLNIDELLAFSKATIKKQAKIGDKFVFDVEKDFRFDAEGNIIAHSIASENTNTDEEKGFVIARKDETGKYKLCIDELLAWGLATMKQLHVKGESTFDGNLFSKEFISRFLGGKGWGIYNKPITNAAGMQENKWTGEFDNVIVRGSLRVYEMIISQLLGENDNRIFTGMMEVDHYDPETGKVYFDTQGGKLYNPFRKDDCIMVQQYNGMPGSSNDYYVIKSYELVITEAGCGSTADGENRLDWVKFDSFSSSTEGATPDKLIKKKDTFVRVDNLSDPDRKGIMQIITVGTAAPYLDILYGMKTDPENCLKGRLGNLQGIHHRTFGDLTGFGELLQNLYATGDLILRRTGESIDTKFQMLQNQFATRFAQTTYELTNEDNYIQNGTFLAATGTDSNSLIIDGWEIDETDESAIWVCGGMPVMVNGQVTTSGNRRVLIEATEGRNMLRIINCGLKQANALIRQPGTHKEYTKPSETKNEDGLGTTGDGYTEVQDTLYISARVYAKTAGTMTIGFSPSTAVDGKKNELAAQSVNIAYSGEWQFVKMEGKWNGKGDFVIRYTGDILVSFLYVTDKPLDNLQKTVSTQILQTASNIKLLGENIDKVNGRTTQLGIELDAEKKEIRAYVDEQDKALDKSFRAQISITKGDILAEVNEKDNALKTELTSSIDVQAGQIALLNKWTSDTDTRISGIETDITKVRAYVDEQDDALDKSFRSEISMTKDKIMASVTEKDKALETDYTSQISMTKNEILQEVTKKNNALNETLSSKIEHEAGRINILNSWQTSTEKRMSSIESNIDSIKLEVSDVKETADNTSAALAKLTITVDGINTAVGKAATKDELSAAQETLSSEMTSNDEEVRKYIDGIDSDIRSDYGTTVSLVKQNSDSWSVAAGAFYSDGTLRECGGLSVSTYFTNLFNKKITLDSSGNVKNISKSGLLVTADKTALETKISNVDGKIISSATIETMISNGISKASIRADQISLEGVVTANKYFKINTDGSMQASAGQIAGMKIEGEGLTNKGFDNDAYIILRNDSHKVFAGIGGNVLPASTGTRAVARFTNEESSKFFGDVNYSVVCGAKGAVNNVALDMTLGGYVAGLRIKNAYMSSGGSTYATAKDIDKNVHSVVLAGAGYYRLPKMEKWDDGYVILVKRATDSGAVHLCTGVSVTVDSVTAADRRGTSFLYYDRGSGTTDLEIKSSGDAMMLVYHREMIFTVTENKKEKKYYGCWIQYKCPRDW